MFRFWVIAIALVVAGCSRDCQCVMATTPTGYVSWFKRPPPVIPIGTVMVRGRLSFGRQTYAEMNATRPNEMDFKGVPFQGMLVIEKGGEQIPLYAHAPVLWCACDIPRRETVTRYFVGKVVDERVGRKFLASSTHYEASGGLRWVSPPATKSIETYPIEDFF